jgi:hypothetical protein
VIYSICHETLIAAARDGRQFGRYSDRQYAVGNRSLTSGNDFNYA